MFIVRRKRTHVLRVALPGAAGLGLWLLYNQRRTGDPLRFFDAKRAWHEVDLLTFVQRPGLNATIHFGIAAAAVALVIAARRWLPTSWLVYTVLYLVPWLALGMVGLGRYANDTFPPFSAAGDLLAQEESAAIAAVFATLVVTQVALTYWFIAKKQVV